VPNRPYQLSNADSVRSLFRWTIGTRATIDSIVNPTTRFPVVYFNAPGPKTAVVEEYTDSVARVCFKASERFNFYLRFPPSDSVRIIGDSSVCFEDSIPYIALDGQPGSTYRWSITQGPSERIGFFSSGELTDRVMVDYMREGLTGMQYGQDRYFINVQEISRDECPGKNYKHMIFNACTGPPNLVTPNNDGFNDKFVIPNAELYSDNELQVFGRHGREVYNQKGFKNDLDVDKLATGVYYYYFKVNVEGTQKIYKGWLEVLK
jgi:gliding motility-associated-like protein